MFARPARNHYRKATRYTFTDAKIDAVMTANAMGLHLLTDEEQIRAASAALVEDIAERTGRRSHHRRPNLHRQLSEIRRRRLG